MINNLLTDIPPDPYTTYLLQVEAERKKKGLNINETTIGEVEYKLEEIKQRYKVCCFKGKTQYFCVDKHFNDARNIAGGIEKAGKVTRKQWNKLIDISFMLFEIPHPEGLHYCRRR